MSRAEKTRCSGQWTEARYRSFIISALRSATCRWGPKAEALRNARVKRGEYVCNLCNKHMGATAWRVYKSGKKKGKPKKVKDAIVDHIVPVVDPVVGFTTWDDYIERMFCEVDNFQVICHDCHEAKCSEELNVKKARNNANPR